MDLILVAFLIWNNVELSINPTYLGTMLPTEPYTTLPLMNIRLDFHDSIRWNFATHQHNIRCYEMSSADRHLLATQSSIYGLCQVF